MAHFSSGTPMCGLISGLHRTVLDGELVVLRNGIPDFFELQRRTLLTDRLNCRLMLLTV